MTRVVLLSLQVLKPRKFFAEKKKKSSLVHYFDILMLLNTLYLNKQFECVRCYNYSEIFTVFFPLCCRYYFKKASDEFECGAVFEEVSDDCSMLPMYEGKILGKVERMD